MTVMSSLELRKLRNQQNEQANHDKAGLLRRHTSNVIAGLAEDDIVLVMNFGNEAIALNKHGNEVVSTTERTTDDPDNPVVTTTRTLDARTLTRGWHVDFGPEMVPGSVSTNKVVDGVRIPAGVVLVVGGASTAKTPMVYALASAGVESFHVIRYGEPLAGYIVDPRKAAIELGRAMIFGQDIVFDSVKDLLAYAPGGAMSSGLSRGSLPILSDLSAMASTVGCSIYVPLNPSTPATDIVEMVVEAAKSNVAMVLTTTGSNEGEGTSSWITLARRGEGLQRETATFKASFDSDSLMVIGSSNSAQKGNNASAFRSSVVGADTLNNLLRRHINSNSN